MASIRDPPLNNHCISSLFAPFWCCGKKTISTLFLPTLLIWLYSVIPSLSFSVLSKHSGSCFEQNNLLAPITFAAQKLHLPRALSFAISHFICFGSDEWAVFQSVPVLCVFLFLFASLMLTGIVI
ncbi:hypothetical protein GOODEAATRI_003885 [Goodea atripinnis]|uniref:Uncharacterized protein n=1 Tax=Goodea atripinnis TaxID=208336 RepID=A0ABV0PB67_9TELE